MVERLRAVHLGDKQCQEAIAQACAFYSSMSGSMSVIGI
jgi:hypothetical protein